MPNFETSNLTNSQIMKRTILIFLLLVATLHTSAQISTSMHYTVSLDTIGKYLNVQLDYTATRPSDDILFKMPVWAPGYYMILNYPKHLCDFTATDSQGTALRWKKQGKNGWLVSMPADGKAIIKYRIFSDERDVASNRIDSHTAFIAPNGVFMYVDEEKYRPVSVTYEVPTNWKSVSMVGIAPRVTS